MKSDKNTDATEMLRLYLRDRYALETEEKVQQWLAKNPVTEEMEQASKEYWDSLSIGKDATTFEALKRVNTKIGIQLPKTKTVRLKFFSRVAAIFILLVGISGVWLYLQHYNRATMIEISAAYGETKQIALPDQTEVWLNAGSSLKYPSEFSQKVRSVRLTGEAFFSVTKNQSKPFVVETKNLAVKVLGTKFNLKAYPDEHQTVATLQEGKIEVQTAKLQKQQLVPNEQLVYNNETSTLKMAKINPEDIPDWKSGNLIFSESTLGEILQTLERCFNISFDTDKSIDLSSEHYTIKFEREETPTQILQVLADMAGDFSYSVKNEQIILKNK
ncbi:FecR family protein [Maribellus maritimus]|uniref:FecR family protein n=1 Tax=Maribellus maritimus TaxID=2870838 RepID=UPI001EEA10AF|nr:FecR family protein [Maribellus maritimus]MCG6188100.1 FecR domain-containing protein [Maribellus maritimus]